MFLIINKRLAKNRMKQEIIDFILHFNKKSNLHRSSKGHYKYYEKDLKELKYIIKILNKLKGIKVSDVLTNELEINMYNSNDKLVRFEGSGVWIHSKLYDIIICYLISYCRKGLEKYIENSNEILSRRDNIFRVSVSHNIGTRNDNIGLPFEGMFKNTIEHEDLINPLLHHRYYEREPAETVVIQIDKIEKELEKSKKDFDFSKMKNLIDELQG